MTSEPITLHALIQACVTSGGVPGVLSGESIFRPRPPCDCQIERPMRPPPPPKPKGEPKPPTWLRQRSSRWFTLWACSFSIFTDVFLYGLIVPVIPFALADRIGLEEANVQHWTSTLLAVYGAALFIGSPLSGWWADKVERRRIPFLAGLLLLSVATLMLCLAQSIPTLIVARVLQGLSGSVVWAVAIAIVMDKVGVNKFGANMGFLTIARTVGVFLGPLMGGFIYAKAGYNAVYGASFVLLGADISFRFFLIETREAKKWGPSLGPESEGTTRTGGDGEHDSKIEEPSRVRGPTGTPPRTLINHLPPFMRLLGSIRILVAIWGCFVQAIVFGSMDAVIPLFVEGVFGWDSFGAGLIFLCLMIPTLLSPIFGSLADSYGPRWYAGGGLLATTIPLVLLRLVTHSSIEQKVLLCALLALLSAFSTCFEIPFCVDLVLAVEEKGQENPVYYGGKGAYAQAFGVNNMVWAAGLVVGPLWGGFIFENVGWGTMTWTLGLLVAVSVVPSVIWVGGYIFDKPLKKVTRRTSSTAVLVDAGE